MRVAYLCLVCTVTPYFTQAADRPNIVWITAEDMSPALGCYGDEYSHTPSIDRLARESVLYTHVFATAPVCSPVRSTLITGCYAQTLGTHNMRSGFPLPADVTGFPSYLRDAGYYTSNNVKTDYNTISAERLIKNSWDESSSTAHWRKRPQPDQPFFCVFNLMTSHQSRSMVWPYEKFDNEVRNRLPKHLIHRPDEAPLPAYYPDTPGIRREWARFYDCVTVMDQEVGAILNQLREDKLDDSTIVFFFSDHGSGMPRHKRTLLDTGMHVPLLVRVPERWKHFAPDMPGSRTDRLVSFVDFAPTVLRLAGLTPPKYMQGISFIDSESAVPNRQYVAGHRDRVDEAFDCSRSLRSRRYLYIRNFMPHLGYHQPTAWPDQGTIRAEISRAALSQELTAPQKHYTNATRPVEELYDCQLDPLNLTNLAESEAHQPILQQLRTALEQQTTAFGDFGFLPESSLADQLTSADTFQMRRSKAIASAKAMIFAAGQTERAGPLDITANKEGSAEARQFWQAVQLHSRQTTIRERRQLESQLTAAENEPTAAAIEVAFVLTRQFQSSAALQYLINCTSAQDLNHVLRATRSIELLGHQASEARPAMQDVAARCEQILPSQTTATFVQSPEQDLAMFISFSANAFLNKLNADNLKAND